MDWYCQWNEWIYSMQAWGNFRQWGGGKKLDMHYYSSLVYLSYIVSFLYCSYITLLGFIILKFMDWYWQRIEWMYSSQAWGHFRQWGGGKIWTCIITHLLFVYHILYHFSIVCTSILLGFIINGFNAAGRGSGGANLPINQSTNQPIDESTNLPIYQWGGES